MNKISRLSFFLFLFYYGDAQTNFSAPDTVCVNSQVSITNNTPAGSTFFWNFCVADVTSNTPIGVNLGNPGNLLQLPVFMDIAQYNNKFYGFVINNFPGKLTRLDFGNSLLNTPTTVNLGNFSGAVPDAAEGIQVVQSAGKWFAIIVGGNVNTGERISKLEFGVDLSNPNPVATNWGNLGNMAYPVDLHVFNENNNWYGFTLNFANHSITRFNFGSDFSKPPVALNLGNVGNLNGPTGINAIKENNNWFVFVTNTSSNTLTRLDFGNSLLNTPTGVNIGNPGNQMNEPRDLYLMKFCGSTVGFVVNKGSDDIVRLNFTQGVNVTPSAVSLGNAGSLNFPHSISRLFRVNNDLYSFITNVNNNSITRLEFKGCNNNNIPNSSLFTPPTYSYSTPGTYNISLTVDEGLPTQSSFCKTIVVLPKPLNVPYRDTAFCLGSSISISSSVLAPSYSWNTNAITRSITINTGGTYTVDAHYFGCTIKDTIKAVLKPIPQVFLGIDTSVCLNSGYSLNAGNAGSSYIWHDGTTQQTHPVTTSGKYYVIVNLNGCRGSDTINIVAGIPQNFTLGVDTIICEGSSYNITPSNSALSYTWQDGTVSSSFKASKAGLYYATAPTCAGLLRDSIMINTKTSPFVFLGNDTTICPNSSLVLNAGNASSSYTWQDGSASQTYLVSSAGSYYVTVSKNGCKTSDTINIQTFSPQTFTLGNDTSFCDGSNIIIKPNNTSLNYLWQDGTTQSSYIITRPGVYYASAATCGGIIRDTIVVTSKPVPVILLGSDTTICSNSTFTLSAGNTGSSYTWHDGTTLQTHSVKASGKYVVVVNRQGCIASDTVNIIYNVLPNFSLGADTNLCLGSSIILRPFGNISSPVTWQDGSNANSFLVSTGGTYYAYISTNCGISSDTISIKSGVCEIYVPSAFTPNGDGRNDVFKILGAGLSEVNLKVYNRWGEKLFETNDKEKGWDGRVKAVLQQAGTFIYYVQYKKPGQQQFQIMKGTFILIR